MAITVSRVPRKKKLAWPDRIYVRAILKGLWITLRHLLRPRKFTMQYPEERWPFPRGYRGAPTLVKHGDGHEKCVACLLCMFVCPPEAIYIEPGETDRPIEREPRVFDIDFSRCIFCGYCEEVCPEEAIILKEDFEFAASSRDEMIYDKRKLLEMGEVVLAAKAAAGEGR